MSDLAPFVAATLRDKVVEDLLEENKRLRKEIQENAKEQNEILADEAIRGNDQSLRIAVAGPAVEGQKCVVYATQPLAPISTSKFWTINDCTLGDLSDARIFVNGDDCGSFLGEGKIGFVLNIDFTSYNNEPPRKEIKSLDDIDLPSGSKDFAQFSVSEFRYGAGLIFFELKGVPKHKWFELAEIDLKEYLAAPFEIDILTVSFSLGELIEFFGAETEVLFLDADDIFR